MTVCLQTDPANDDLLCVPTTGSVAGRHTDPAPAGKDAQPPAACSHETGASRSALAVSFKRKHLILLLALVSAQPAWANDLIDLYHLALARDAVLQAAIQQRDAAIEARPQAWAALLPQIAASASAGREREGFQDQGQTPLGPTNEVTNCALSSGDQMQTCYTNFHGYGLTLSQTIWSFSSFARLKEANAVAAGAEATLLAAQQDLLLRVATAYFAILAAQDQLATEQRARAAFGHLLSQTETREKIGVSAHGDVAQAQAFYDATAQSVIDAQNALDDAQLALTEIVGDHSPNIAPLRDDIPLVSPDPDSVEAWVASARQDNPTVRAAELQAEAAERNIAVQRGMGLPSFTLNGSSMKTWQDLQFGGNNSLDSVELSFTWPLFQGGAIASAVRQSRATYREEEALYDTAQRDAERQTRAAFRNVVTGILRIKAARRAVESGRLSVEASQRNVEFGTGSVFDLLNAQNNYYGYELAYSQTRYDYLTALLTLKQQAGNLSEHDLEVIDALLVSHDGT